MLRKVTLTKLYCRAVSVHSALFCQDVTSILILKFLFVLTITIPITKICDAQKHETHKTIPLLTINNQSLNQILDSIITFSLKCEGKGINQLKFFLLFKDIDFNTSEIYISLMDCEGLNWALKSSDPRQTVYGYFIFRSHIFVVSGQVESTELFKMTKSKSDFKFTESEYLLGKHYSVWIYVYSGESDFKLLQFHPICDPNSVYPICNEIEQIKTKR
jgi:hypothetical protein